MAFTLHLFGLDPNLECIKVSSSTNLSKSFDACFKMKELPKRFSEVSRFWTSLKKFSEIFQRFPSFSSLQARPSQDENAVKFKIPITLIHPLISVALTHLTRTKDTRPPSYLKNPNKYFTSFFNRTKKMRLVYYTP